MNNYSTTYSFTDGCRNLWFSAKYVVNNLFSFGNRVNIHTFSSRVFYFIENILNVNTLAKALSPTLLYISSDLYLHNGAPPLRAAACKALHHRITALPVGTHRVLLETPYYSFYMKYEQFNA